MESSKRDKLISLIFPVVTVLYGCITLYGGMYQLIMQRMTGFITIAAGLITGVLIMLLKINTFDCLKTQTIAFVVTLWLHLVTKTNIIRVGQPGFILDAISVVYYLIVDLGSIVIMMFNLPKGITVRQRLAVFFANPVLYMLFNSLMNVLSDFLEDNNLLG